MSSTVYARSSWSATPVTGSAPPSSRSTAVEVRRYQPTDEPAVVELLGAAFGVWPQGIEGVAPAEFFRWKLQACPFGNSISLVAHHDGQVIGFASRLPWRLRVGGQTINSLRGMDLAVHPSHRGRGVSRMIMRASREDTPDEVAIRWENPNEQSRRGLLTTGGRGIVLLQRFARAQRTPARTLGRILRDSSTAPSSLEVEAEPAGDLLRDGDYVSHVLGSIEEPGGRLVTARDIDYLRWRYGRFAVYRALRADPGRDDPGIVIFRLRRRGSLWASEICELLVARENPRTGRHLLARVAAAAPTDFLIGCFDSRRRAARLGFLPAGGHLQLTAQPTRSGLPDLTRRGSWGLSFGDLELL